MLDELGVAPAQFARITGTRHSSLDAMLQGNSAIPPSIWTMAALLQLPGAMAIARSTSGAPTYDTFDEVMCCAAPRIVSDRAVKPRRRTSMLWHRQFD
jgi:hypothetical protein